VSDEGGHVGDHINRRDTEIFNIGNSGERLVEAGRHAGEIERSDDHLSDGKPKRRHVK